MKNEYHFSSHTNCKGGSYKFGFKKTKKGAEQIIISRDKKGKIVNAGIQQQSKPIAGSYPPSKDGEALYKELRKEAVSVLLDK